MTWTLDIPVAVPSANTIKRALYAGKRGMYGRIRRDFAWAVKVVGVGVPKATGKRLVRVTRIMGPHAKTYDADNLIAGCKPLMDELVAHGLLVDDRPEYMAATYGQERGPEHGTRVELEDV